MNTAAPQSPRLSAGKKLGFSLLLVAFLYLTVEGLAFLFYKPITGESFGDPGIGEMVAPEEPDVRPGREQAGLGMRDAAMSIHPYFGYVYTPRSPEDEPGRIPISEDGFLDELPAIRKKEAGKVLVGIFGGSVSGQLGTFFSGRLEEELRRLPEFDGRDIEFLRLGMPGYHQPQQVQQLTWILAQGGELDILLNIDGFNEVAVPAALNAPQGANPLFPMNWSMVSLDVPDLELRRNIGAVTYLQERRRSRAESFRQSILSRSVLAKLIWKVDDLRMARDIAGYEWELNQFQVDEVPYFIRGPERWHDPDGGLVPACVDVWKRCSIQLQALCEAHEIRYLHLLQPNQYLPNSKPLSNDELEKAFDAEGPYRPVIEEGYPLMQAAGDELAARGIEFVDLSLLFESERRTVYADNCCHYNALGNELLCKAIARAVGGVRSNEL